MVASGPLDEVRGGQPLEDAFVHIVGARTGGAEGLSWLAVPIGLAWGAFLCWRSVRLAQQRLENHGPEIFARVRG